MKINMKSNLKPLKNCIFPGMAKTLFLLSILYVFISYCNINKKNCDVTDSGCNSMGNFILQALLFPNRGPLTVTIQPWINAISLSWTKVDSATGYKVYRKISENVSTSDKEITGGFTTGTTISENGITGGEKRYYRVSALINGIESSLSKEVSATAIVTPNDISPSKIAFWYKADSLTLGDGASVASWSDSGSFANTLTQGTPANQPVFKTNQLNGYPVVRFDGVNDEMLKTGGTGFASSTNKIIFLVLKRVQIIDTALFIIGNNWRGVFGYFYHFAAGKSGVLEYCVTASQFPNTNPNLLAQSYGPSIGNPISCYTNGKLDGEVGNTNPLTYGPFDIYIGSLNGIQWSSVDIAEIIYYDGVALTQSQRESIDCYLATKYALALNHTCVY